MSNDSVLLCNTLILSNCLRDNLDILSDKGIATGKLKAARNQFHVQLSKLLNQTYSNPDIGSLEWLNNEIDLSVEIESKVFKLGLEDKQKVNRFIDQLVSNEYMDDCSKMSFCKSFKTKKCTKNCNLYG